MSRNQIFIGNWKMHKTLAEANEFLQGLSKGLSPQEKFIGLAVPYTLIYPLSKEIKETSIRIGAQNMNDATSGAFTGEIAGNMLIDVGATFVLLGHSERRQLFHENNEFINHKVKKAVESGLQPVLCVGETLPEFNEKKTHEVIERQLTEGLKNLTSQELQNLMIAYEPVWAIGNGQSADPEITQEVHYFCRQILTKLFEEKFADQVSILYGGSVSPINASDLMAQPDIDGLLIGGASLSLETFLEIVNDNYSKIQLEG
ncbi:MAG: triose-phosphate isomerase [Parachlamydiaceae bacterium]|nr:triose-phosphate isomerase [Parachlamydiaceae bacterium]